MEQYVNMKWRADARSGEDLHGVRDAIVDIEIIDAQIQVLQEILSDDE